MHPHTGRESKCWRKTAQEHPEYRVLVCVCVLGVLKNQDPRGSDGCSHWACGWLFPLTRVLCLRRIVLVAVLLLIFILFLRRVEGLVLNLRFRLPGLSITSLQEKEEDS